MQPVVIGLCVSSLNLERTKKFSVEMPEFQYFYPFFSRKGWILFTLAPEKFCAPKGPVVDPFFLINPLTKGKIPVSDVVIDDPEGLCLHNGCFSIGQDGFPNSIVICYTDFKTLRFYITTYPPGGGRESFDQVWTNSYVVKGFFCHAPGNETHVCRCPGKSKWPSPDCISPS